MPEEKEMMTPVHAEDRMMLTLIVTRAVTAGRATHLADLPTGSPPYRVLIARCVAQSMEVAN